MSNSSQFNLFLDVRWNKHKNEISINFTIPLYVVEKSGNSLHPHWIGIWILVFNATFSNISAISWRLVLVWRKREYPERTTDPGKATGKLDHLRLRVDCTLFCNLQIWARTHAVVVIGLYELLDPTNSLLFFIPTWNKRSEEINTLLCHLHRDDERWCWFKVDYCLYIMSSDGFV